MISHVDFSFPEKKQTISTNEAHFVSGHLGRSYTFARYCIAPFFDQITSHPIFVQKTRTSLKLEITATLRKEVFEDFLGEDYWLEDQ